MKNKINIIDNAVHKHPVISILECCVVADNKKTRISYKIEADGIRKTVWFETDEWWGKYFCNEVADGMLVMLLQYAILGGYDILSEVPVSKSLLYRLKYHVIPQLALCTMGAYETKITVPVYEGDFEPKEIATGMSLGVDSFTTFFEYTKNCPAEADPITLLTFFDACHHHLAKDPEKVFEEQLLHTEKFCSEFGYRLLVMRSNVHETLATMFPLEFFKRESLEPLSTFRNCGFVLLLQKLIKTYYYSASFSLDSFKCDLYGDVTKYEKWLFPLVSTDCTEFWSTNRAMTRIEKTQFITQFTETYRYLTVCSYEGQNCGHCEKCIRTELTLDKIGKLDLYEQVFDVEGFRKRKRHSCSELLSEKGEPLYDEVIELCKKDITLKNRIVGRILHMRRYNPTVGKWVDKAFDIFPSLRKIYRQ